MPEPQANDPLADGPFQPGGEKDSPKSPANDRRNLSVLMMGALGVVFGDIGTSPLYALRAKRKGYEVSAMKVMMDQLGLAGGPVRPPLAELRPDEQEWIRAALKAWRAWV